jgi:hypothetical protein
MNIARMILFMLIVLSSTLSAQQPIFPGLSGDDLLQALQGSYTPATVLEYNPARDSLYTSIDNVNDTVYGIYTTHGIYLPPGEAPRNWLYRAGDPNGPGGVPDAINAEHSYPQSKGATKGTNGHSDMHHLFPSRLAVNEDRGSLPFGEIEDVDTDVWYYKNQELGSIPATNMDAYSEGDVLSFEPRESVKGNIARAIFYFYTIYRQNAENADPDFFDLQRADLCQWHMLDPADGQELDRSSAIAAYQSGVENPFIQDCSLAKRLYCPELGDSCGMVGLYDEALLNTSGLKAFWRNNRQLDIYYDTELIRGVEVSVINFFGQYVVNQSFENVNIGRNYFQLEMPSDLPSGMYLINLNLRDIPSAPLQRVCPLPY